jgi:serpin B
MVRDILRGMKQPFSLRLCSTTLFASALLLSSCNHSKVEESSNEKAATKSATAESKTKAELGPEETPFQLFRLLNHDPKNTLISPFSIKMAYQTLYPGASDSGKSFLEKLFDFRKVANSNPTESELLIGNSIWSKDPKKLHPDFLASLKSSRIESHSLKLKEMNEWVSNMTKGKISKILDKLEPSQQLVVLNAIYLKANWQKPFNEATTIRGKFQSSPYGISAVKMMQSKEEHRYFEDDLSKWIELGYNNSSLVMLLGLPKKRFELEKVGAKLDSQYLKTINAGLKSEKVDLVLPRFKFDTKDSLKHLMSMAGFNSLFEKGAFTKVMKSGDQIISDVIQASSINVNEQGTEAAAATAIALENAIVKLAPSKKFYADEPFFFILRNSKSGEIYFIGRVYQP